MILTLPFPPSTNGLFTNRRGGRAATKRYLAWQERAGFLLKTQQAMWTDATAGLRIGPCDSCAVKMVFGRPDKRKRDLDNLLKAPIDLLVKHGLIGDDRNIQRLEACWGDAQGVRIVVGPA